MKKVFVFAMSLSMVCYVQIASMDKKKVMIPPLNLKKTDPLEDYRQTTPRTLASLLTHRSPRTDDQDCCDSCSCFFYYCFCLPIWYSCPRGNDSYQDFEN